MAVTAWISLEAGTASWSTCRCASPMPCPSVAQCLPDGQPDACGLSLDPGPCRAAVPRWGHDPASGRCVRFTYGGCGGNSNNFTTEQECQRACGPREVTGD
jgi:hypothetical protein